MKYCPDCRAELHSREINGSDRRVCSSSDCRFVHWNNPVPVVAALVRRDGHYILARGTEWPAGLFSMLTGFLEAGERPEQAVCREVEEELGLRTVGAVLIGHFPLVQLNQLIIAYAVTGQGELRTNDEIAELRFVSPGELAVFDFGPLELTREVVAQWLESPGA